MDQREPEDSAETVSRRKVIKKSAALAAGAATAGWMSGGELNAQKAAAEQAGKGAAQRASIRQSIVFWCFNVSEWKWSVEKTCQVAKTLGCKSVEIVDPKEWPTLKKHGLTCAIAPNGMPGPPFMKGFNNKRYHDRVIASTQAMIDACAEYEFPSVIAFTGYKWRSAEDPTSGEISLDEGADNSVAGLRKVAAYAEKKGVTVCLEMLNTRDETHPMKGHPGYQGDDIDYVAEIVQRVGSPAVKLLFDLYHVQIMNGDLVRRLRQYADLIGHVHTAGNPGRGELDPTQEISYPACMRTLLETGYEGYVGQEFIPTRDPHQGLAQAVELCDV